MLEPTEVSTSETIPEITEKKKFYRGKEHPALNLFTKVFGKILI